MPCTAQTTLQRVGNPDPQHAGEALRTRASQTRSAPATSLRGELPQRHSTGQPSAAKRTRFNLASARFVSRDPNRQAPKPSGRTDVHRGSRRPPSRPPARGLHCRHCCAIYLHAPSRSLSGPGGRVPATHRLGSSAETAGFPKLRAERLTYRRRLSYNTASNKTRLSRTPGNRIVYLYTKKVGKAPKSACGVCPGRLRGVRAVRPKVLMRLSKTKKHVSRAYGGSMCAKCVRDRIKRAFLIEEQKIVVKVLKAQAQSQKAK